jgi:hypothetical protein
MELVFVLAAVGTIVTTVITVYEWAQKRKRTRDGK